MDYWFVSEEDFSLWRDQEAFLEWAEVHGHHYGTRWADVERGLEAGKCVVLEIDVQGARRVKALFPDALLIFIMPRPRRPSKTGCGIEAAKERTPWSSAWRMPSRCSNWFTNTVRSGQFQPELR